MMKRGIYFKRKQAGISWPPGSRITILVTFENGRWTLDDHIAGVLGAALYLTPTGTEAYDLREQLAVQAVPNGKEFTLFSRQIPHDLMGHLDVVLECSGGQTITETFHVAAEFA